MKAWEFPKALASGNLPASMMLFGASPYMIDYYIKKLSLLYAPQDEPLKLYHSEYNFATAKAHLSQGSLFGGSNLLIIKSEKKIPKKELDELISMVAKSPTNFFIYAYYGSDYSTSHKSFDPKKTASEHVRFFEPKIKDAVPLLQEEAHRIGLQIDHATLSHLFNSQNGDIALSINELSKLAILNRPVQSKDIDALVFSLADVKLDDIIANLLEKKDFKNDLAQLLESGEEPPRVIANISNFVTVLFKFLAYIKLNGSVTSRAVLGFQLPPDIERQRIDLARRFTLQSYQQMLQLLLDCELELKHATGQDKDSILYAGLLRLQSIL